MNLKFKISKFFKNDGNNIDKFILLSGLMLRLMYIYYTPIDVRQHDVHQFFQNQGGHSDYILYLYENHALPDFDPRTIFQFYHPPLQHIICALWLSFVKLLGFSIEDAGVNTLQFLTVFYSFLFAVLACKTFKRLNLTPKTVSFCTAVVTFHPTLIIMSGSINNDMLSSLFGMSAIYFTVKWADKKDFKSIIMIALSVGLGMFTKLSVGLLAPAIAAVFICVFIKNFSQWKKFILQFLGFGIVCVPVGLFWSVRNYVKFGISPSYVPELGENSEQYIDKTAFERLFNWQLFQFESPFTQWEWFGASYNEFNPIIALWKNSMFDELTFFDGVITMQAFCTALFFSGVLLSLFSVAALIIMWLNDEVKIENKLLITIISVTIFGNYVNFCLRYPQVCTQNMRYCVPLIFAGAAACGMWLDRAGGNYEKIRFKITCILKKNILAFCGFSVFVYIALGF